jgi:hypothetical protein
MPVYGSYAALLMLARNSPVGDVPVCLASRTAFSIVSAPWLESANLRKIQFIREVNLLKALPRLIWIIYLGEMRHELE